MNNISSVFGSGEQVFAVAPYTSDEELAVRWQAAADELATSIQGKLSSELDGLRWDIYLLFVVPTISEELKMTIEGDRHYFRKLVLTDQERPQERLPLALDFSRDSEMVLFNDTEFLRELETVVPDTVVNRLGDGFFKSKDNSVAQLLSAFDKWRCD